MRRVRLRTLTGGAASRHSLQYIGQSLRNCCWGVKCRQHGIFQAVDIQFALHLRGAVLTDQLVQFQCQREQLYVGFRSLHGIRQITCWVENTFQPAETAIVGKPLPFFGSGRPSCLIQLESCAYRLDVVPQLGFAVKYHFPRSE